MCRRVDRIVGRFIDVRDLGRVTCNDTGVITVRKPDTTRRADFADFRYERLPKASAPKGDPPVAPDLVIEVRSPSDCWSGVPVRVADYLEAGARIVCVLDLVSETARLFRANGDDKIVARGGELSFPGRPPDFRESLRRLFESPIAHRPSRVMNRCPPRTNAL